MTALTPQSMRTMATSLEAGMAMEALLADQRLGAILPTPVRQALRRALQTDGGIGAALRRADIVDDGMAAILDAGARGGFLPRAMVSCAEILESRVKRQRRLLAAVAYPAFVMLAASLLLPLPVIVSGGVGAWLGAAAPGVVTVTGLLVVVFVVLPRLSPGARGRITDVVAALPIIGGVVVDDARAGVLTVLHQLMVAGVPATQALGWALDASPVGRFRRAGPAAAAVIQRGGTLTDAIDDTGLLSPSSLAQVAVAEQTGTLERVLPVVAAESTAQAGRRFTALAIGVGVVIFAAVAIAIGVSIVSGFVGYIDTVDTIGRE